MKLGENSRELLASLRGWPAASRAQGENTNSIKINTRKRREKREKEEKKARKVGLCWKILVLMDFQDS